MSRAGRNPNHPGLFKINPPGKHNSASSPPRLGNALNVFLFCAALPFLTVPVFAQEHNWNSHAEVAKKVIENFEALNSFQSDFAITTTDQVRTKNMSGRCYYLKPGKLRFAFDQPFGDLIVSNGKLLWIYIQRLGAAGKQDLTLNKKDETGRDIFMKSPATGLSRLFRKYHYRFDSAEQPRKEKDGSFFVLDMEQREKVGGYEKIKLFIDPKSYLVSKAVAQDGLGKTTIIHFTNIQVNKTLEGNLFKYEPGDNVRVVDNPLVSE